MMRFPDETTCIMDRFSGIVYFTLTGLSVILVMSFLVVCTLIKGVLTAYFRMAKRWSFCYKKNKDLNSLW